MRISCCMLHSSHCLLHDCCMLRARLLHAACCVHVCCKLHAACFALLAAGCFCTPLAPGPPFPIPHAAATCLRACCWLLVACCMPSVLILSAAIVDEMLYPFHVSCILFPLPATCCFLFLDSGSLHSGCMLLIASLCC